ncbi:Protein-tyrosine-phosphatase [Flagellimonas maritima]|uniref:protein-tyrosine-phosphatase n=1 Tax=Flagellimonas maritima TaxID=1383885 RepID=A0A2Z4LVG8_9FLAO|nr:CpsB/CapC family capsule biosynthesis tyrosine phosphatase [Allomuricauda aurantiaca]AWX45816.1 Protein-tyrosine-phosphatase [Allomuricauda aurantiaca]
MFSFFHKKIFLVDHIHGLVDMHNHILPGIDDGAKNVEDSIKLIKGFSGFGVTNFICTPHIMHHYYPNTPVSIEKSYTLLKKELLHQNLDEISIDTAAEHMIDDNFEKILEEGNTMRLKKDFLLVEMSYLQPPINFETSIEKTKSKGIHPVLAHPERYAYLHKKMDRYYDYKKNANIFFQLNMLSLSNYYGKQIKKTALKLLDEGLYDFISSDVHNLKHLEYIKSINLDKKRLDTILHLINNTIITFA